MILDKLWNLAEETFESTENPSEILSDIRRFLSIDSAYQEVLKRGGMHAFANALRIFSLTKDTRTKNIIWWNSPSTWKEGYKDFFEDAWSFAEDVFGNQFMFVKNGIAWLGNETGKVDFICETFTQWITIILKDLDYYTGSSIAYKWQKNHLNEKLTGRFYLCPIKPFICGGTYEIDNLFKCKDQECLAMKASFARQIKDLPDGTKIQIKFTI